jgi:mitochondrial enoyl-[acyl-carrier protein] reductase / trans-2-enoyl-CoA reductase
MLAIQFSKFGPAQEVAEVAELPDPPAPGPGDVLVELVAAPINPSDLLMMRGEYGIRPELPAVGGNEGMGRVAAVGEGVTHLNVGDRVSLAGIRGGTWRERTLAKGARLAPLPEADPLQLAMLTANPATALILLEEFVPLAPGDWVAQNAANSAVGQAVITLAAMAGVRTLSVVRRESLVEPLRAAGGDVVLVDGPDLARRAREALDAAGAGRDAVKVAFDAVAGSATSRLARLVAHGGTVVNYGALSGEPCHVEPRETIFRGVTLRGFWLVTWFSTAPAERIAAVYGRLGALVADGTLHTPVEATYPLREAKAALAHAGREGRGGKVLLVAG